MPANKSTCPRPDWIAALRLAAFVEQSLELLRCGSLCVLAGFSSNVVAAEAGAGVVAGAVKDTAQILGVVVNASLVADSELVRIETPGPGYWVRAEAAREWHIKNISLAHFSQRLINDELWVRLCEPASGWACQYDDSGSLLLLTIPAVDLEPVRIAAVTLPRTPPSESDATGAYLNYDLDIMRGRYRLSTAVLDGHVFSPWGSGVVQSVALIPATGEAYYTQRAYWQVDFPDQVASLQMGNVSTVNTALTPSTGLLGLTLATNTRLRPDLIRYNRPQLMGDAERASRVELFVDDHYRRAADVAYGPFLVEADSIHQGRGTMQMVETDLTGARKIMTQAYYFAPQLLAPDVSDYAVSAGRLANDPLYPFRTGPTLVSAYYRRGLTPQRTAGIEAQSIGSIRQVGVTLENLIGTAGLATLGAQARRDEGGSQLKLIAGHEYASRALSLYARMEAAVKGCNRGSSTVTGTTASSTATPVNPFNPINGATPYASDCVNVLAGVQNNPAPGLQTGVLMTYRRDIVGTSTQTFGVTATYELKRSQQLLLSAFRTSSSPGNNMQAAANPARGTFINATFIMQFDDRAVGLVSAQRSAQKDGRGMTTQWALQSIENSVDENPDGYRLFGQSGDQGNGQKMRDMDASYYQKTAVGEWRVEALTRTGGSAAGLGFSGSVGWFAGTPFMARRIDESFILVDTDGVPDVPVLLDNRVVGHTNGSGTMVVAEARPYEPNVVSLDTFNLPIEFTVEQDQLQRTPAYNAGTKARFEVSDGGFIIRALDQWRQPLPEGATVTISTQSFATAVNSRGEIFINRAFRPARIEVQWRGGQCSFQYQPVKTASGSIQTRDYLCSNS